jgi:hypothetical protein
MRRPASVALFFFAASLAHAQPGPTGEFTYPYRILPDAVYDASVPTPESVLGFAVGERAAFPDEIVRVF